MGGLPTAGTLLTGATELGRHLIHGHTACRRRYVGFLDRDAAVDRNRFGPRDAAGEDCCKQ